MKFLGGDTDADGAIAAHTGADITGVGTVDITGLMAAMGAMADTVSRSMRSIDAMIMNLINEDFVYP